MGSEYGVDVRDMTGSEKRFRVLVENTADAFFLHDHNGRIIDVNQQACTSLGYSRDEMLKLSVFDVDEKATSEGINRIWLALGKGEHIRIKGMHRRKDGSTFPVEINLDLIEENGQSYLLALARDISEIQQVEKFITGSEEQEICQRPQDKFHRNSDINSLLVNYLELVGGISVDDVIQKTLLFIRDQVGVPHATIALCQDGCRNFHFYDVHSNFHTGLKRGDIIPAEQTILSEVVKEREPRYREDITALDSGYSLDESLVAAGIKSSFLVPLWAEDQCIGTLNLGSDYINGFSEQQRVFISLIAPSLAQVLHKAVLFSLLKESEERYRMLIETTNDLVQSVSPDGRFIFVNEAWLDKLGYNRDEVSTLCVWDIIHESSLDHCQKIFSQIMNGESFQGIGATFRTKEGGVIDVEGNVVPQFKDGKLIGTQGVFQDVSKQKIAEYSLNKSEGMLKMVLSSIPARVFWKDRDSHYLGCNDLFSRDAGLDYPDQIIGKNDYELAWKEQAELYRKDDEYVMQSGQCKLGYEEPQTTPDGSRVWLKTSKVPLKDKGGNVIGMLGTYEDITERKRAEEELLKSKRSLSEAQRIARLGSWELDHINNELNWSDEIYRIFELDPDIYKPSYSAFLDIIHPDDRQRVDDSYQQSLKNKSPYNLVHRLLLKDGRIKYVNESCETTFNSNGEPIRSFGTAQDVTESVLAEEKLRLSDTVFNNTAEAIIVTDSESNIEAENKAFTENTGYSEQ